MVSPPHLLLASLILAACGPPDDPGSLTDATGTTASDTGDTSATPPTGTTADDDDTGAPTTTDDGTAGDSEGDGCGGEVVWIRQFDAAPSTGYNGITIAVDGAGNVILAGYFDDEANFGGDTFMTGDEFEDAFVAKFDPEGGHLWSRQFGGPGEQRVNAVAAAADGSIAIGGYFWGDIDLGGGPLTTAGHRDVFVARLTPDGQHVFSRGFGTAFPDTVADVAVHDDAVVFVANLPGSFDFGGGPVGVPHGDNAFVVKLDAAGDHVWSHGFGSGEPLDAQLPRSIAVDPVGDVLVTGEFQGLVDFGAGPLAANENYAVYVARWTASGQFLWAVQSSGTATSDSPHVGAIASDGAGNVRLGGSFSGTFGLGGAPIVGTGMSDAFVSTLAPQGAPLWSSGYGELPEHHQVIIDLASDAAGRTVVTGGFSGGIDFGAALLLAGQDGNDGFVAKLGPDGAPLWSRAFGEDNWTVGSEVAIDGAGNVWVAGLFRDVLTIDGHSLVADDYDTFLVKLCP